MFGGLGSGKFEGLIKIHDQLISDDHEFGEQRSLHLGGLRQGLKRSYEFALEFVH